jgi:hypothetical protein
MNQREMEEQNPEGFTRRRRAARLEAQIATLANHMHAADYRLVAMLRMFEELRGWEGWASPAHWLSWRCGYSLGAAREKFRVARALPGLPLVRTAFKKGELSFAQVRAMTRIARPENEATVLMWAKHSTASHMERLARLYKRYGENAAALAQHRARSFTYMEESDGTVSFRISLPAEQAAVVLKAIEAAKATLDGQDLDDVSAETRIAMINEPPTHPDEDVSAETRRARNADAFVRLAEAYLEPDARPRALAEKYHVHVHLDLRRNADGPVADPDAPALAEDTIRRLGCEAGLVPVLHDGSGEILSVGRKTRAVPPSIRRALRLRDRGCRFPGCTHTRHVDAHHVKHWADGGETKLSNLVELCRPHHRLLHEGGYSLRLADDGAPVFTRPCGERVPEAPMVFELTGSPPLLEKTQRRLGVSAETHRSRWDGSRPDYGTAIEVLDQRARQRTMGHPEYGQAHRMSPEQAKV